MDGQKIGKLISCPNTLHVHDCARDNRESGMGRMPAKWVHRRMREHGGRGWFVVPLPLVRSGTGNSREQGSDQIELRLTWREMENLI